MKFFFIFLIFFFEKTINLFIKKKKLKNTNKGLDPILIVGCPRSGTTFVSSLLSTSSKVNNNGEPLPNNPKEARYKYDNKILFESFALNKSLFSRIKNFNFKDKIYVEKNINYLPFVKSILQYSNLKIIYVFRDGRDVVPSMINWNNSIFGNFYIEAKDHNQNLTFVAKKNKEKLFEQNNHIDDFGRPRPNKNDPSYGLWSSYNLFQMCSWYWSFTNSFFLSIYFNLSKKLKKRVLFFNCTNPTVKDVKKLFVFSGLKYKKDDLDKIEKLLNKKIKINSLKERFNIDNQFPSYKKWSQTEKFQFDIFANNTMKKLNFYNENIKRLRPKNYGNIWEWKKHDHSWYEWMHNSRLPAHEDLINFYSINKKKINNVLEIGCGISYFYQNLFKNIKYSGLDISKQNVNFCLNNYKNPKHGYYHGDINQFKNSSKFDLVFSQGTIDNHYDMNEFIKKMISFSKKFVYITAYRGWFPEINDHVYSWDDKHQCCYNSLSIKEVKRELSKIKNIKFSIIPLEIKKKNIQFETKIIIEKI